MSCFPAMFALDHKRELSGQWGWMLVSGIIDLALALMIFAGLPSTAAWALGLLVGINMYGRFNPLGVLVPEFRKGRLVEIGDFIADIGDGGLERFGGDRLPDCVADHLDGRRRGIFRRKDADPQRELDVVTELLQRRHVGQRGRALRTETGECS